MANRERAHLMSVNGAKHISATLSGMSADDPERTSRAAFDDTSTHKPEQLAKLSARIVLGDDRL
jgi:hypothetical protein